MRKHFAWNPRLFLGTHDFFLRTHDFFLGTHDFFLRTFYPRPTIYYPRTTTFYPRHSTHDPRLLACPHWNTQLYTNEKLSDLYKDIPIATQCGLLSAHIIKLPAVTCNNMSTDFCKRYDGP